MAIPYEKIVAEDLNQGVGTVPVTMPGGGTATGTRIGLETFSGVRNVRDYGAIGDGAADDTAAIQAAIAAASAHGGIVFLPTGTYRLTTELLITSSGVTLQGTGGYVTGVTSRGTRLVQTSATKDVIRVSSAAASVLDLAFRDLHLIGNAAGGAGNGLLLDGSVANVIARVEISNLEVEQCAGHGVYLKGNPAVGSIFSVGLSKVVCINNKGDGLRVEMTVQVSADWVYAESNLGDQVSLLGNGATPSDSAYLRNITTGGAATGGTYALRISSFDNVHVQGLWTENITADHVLISSSRGVRLQDGSLRQQGTSKGVVIDGDLRVSADVFIDLPGWTNTSTQTLITYGGGSILRPWFGRSANGYMTAADITGAWFPVGAPRYGGDASATESGDVTTAAQTLAGAKTFQDGITLPATAATLFQGSAPRFTGPKGWWHEEFVTLSGETGDIGAPAAASATIDASFIGSAKVLGVLEIFSGTVAASGKYWRSALKGAFKFGSTFPAWYLECGAQWSTTTVRERLGLIGDPSADPPVDGIYFEFDSSVDPHYRCVTRKAGVQTVTTTTIVPSTLARFLIHNTGAHIEFSINDVLVATHTTNLPADATTLAFAAQCVALAGVSENLELDYLTFWSNLVRY